MRKFLLGLVVALGAISMNAQSAGGMWIGGTISGEYEKIHKTSLETTGITINPEIGFILSENIGVGFDFGFGYKKQTLLNEYYEEYYDTDSKAFSIAPFIRYTFLKGNLGGLFLDGGVSYTHIREKADSFDNYYLNLTEKSIANAYSIGIRPGVALNITEKFSLIGKFGFLGYTNIRSEGITGESFKLSMDMKDISLGAVFTF